MSSYPLSLRKVVEPALNLHYPIDTSSANIDLGDIVELKVTTGKISLMADKAVSSGNHQFIGIAGGNWDSSLTDSTIKALEGIPVHTKAIVDATVTSAVYHFGDALMYDNSSDDGTLTAHTTGASEQVVAWVWDNATGARTTCLALVDRTGVEHNTGYGPLEQT